MSYFHNAPLSLYPNKRITYNVAGLEEYIGFSAPGSEEDEKKWTIMLLEYDGSDRLISTKFANGKAKYDLIWTERLAYTYT